MVILQSLPRTTRNGTSIKAKVVPDSCGWVETSTNNKREKKGSNTRANKNRLATKKIIENIAALNSGRGEPVESEIRNRFR